MPADRSSASGSTDTHDRGTFEAEGESHESGKPKHRRSRKGCVVSCLIATVVFLSDKNLPSLISKRCRYLKKKCDEGTPCGRCSLSSSECQYYRAFPYLPPTGRGPAPTSVVTSAVPAGGLPYGPTGTPATYGWDAGGHPTTGSDGVTWDGRQGTPGINQHQQGPLGEAQPWQQTSTRGPSIATNRHALTVAAPSPPSNSALRDDGSELFMDISWQSSIGALCSIGANKIKANEFDYMSGSFLDSPGPWPSTVPPQLAQQDRFTELEPHRQPHQQQPVASTSIISPHRKSTTSPPSFPPYPEAPLDRPAEMPKIPYLFAGSLGPRALPDGSDSELIQYFQNVTTKTIVAIDEAANNPYRTTFLALWRPSRTSSPTPDANSALLHALFCVSAVHSQNLARARMLRGEIELDSFPDFGSRARLHRSQALRLMREAAKARSLLDDIDAEGEEEDGGTSPAGGDTEALERERRDELEVTSAAVMLLVIQSVLEGDSKLVPLLLTNAESYIRRLSLTRLTTSTINLMMLHSVYTVINNIVRGRSLTGVNLLWTDIVESQAGLVKATMGISRNMLELWGRAHSLIVRQREIDGNLLRSGIPPPRLDELRWEAAEIQANLDDLDIQLADEESWNQKWCRAEEAPRVKLGHQFFRAAVRVYILRAGFGTPARDERVQACVKSVVQLTRDTPIGSEVGLAWPLLITGCEALGTDRDEIMSFVKRCQWKGSAPPVRVEQVLMGAWNDGKTKIPLSSIVVEWFGGLFGAHKVLIWVEDLPPLPKTVSDVWIRQEAVDPRGEVKPVTVPVFWLEREQSGAGQRRKARDGERVLLYLVGGGYTSGSPAEGNRTFELARETGLRLMGVNYRKATSDSKAYPAALQDAILAYAHLVLDLGYRDIVLAGDSAGGGLATALLLYLSTTIRPCFDLPILHNSTHPSASSTSLPLPSALVLYSPWCDLTLATYRNGKFPPAYQDDFMNPTMLNFAAGAYLANTFHRPSDAPYLGLDCEQYNTHPFSAGASHPFFSPALATSKPILASVDALYRGQGKSLKFLVISGSAEVFTPEIGAFVKNLEDSSAGLCREKGKGITVEWREEVDELHVFMMVPRWVSPAVARSMREVVDFLATK
ncbi:hypothetical protein P7C70_g2956, partial [Phenoliferia sp. Uapishka_3]